MTRLPESVISYTTLQAVSWLDWSVCSYNDTLAVFRFELSHEIELDYLQTWLQPYEISRAQRFHRKEDRNRFLYTRRIMSVLVGKYSNQHPDEICFIPGHNGKPIIKDTTDWHINVSHSGNWILVAIGKVPIGVDVEKINPEFTFQDMLSHSFSQEEQRFIEASSDSRLAFYQIWTRKESLVKATAKGMDDDFYRIPSLDGVHVVGSELIGSTSDWAVNSFTVTEGYPAALAYPVMNIVPQFYTLDSGLLAR